MEMRVSSTSGKHSGTTPGRLTFSWLYQQVQVYAERSIYPKATRLERWALWTGFLATGIGLLVAALPETLAPLGWALRILKICLLVEVVGFLSSLGLMLRREGKQYIKPRLSQATEMDADFDHWLVLADQLRGFPQRQREERLRFVKRQRHNMMDRTGLFYGGAQKLGPFPVLIALYLQFRTWTWGDWAGAFDVNFVAGILIFAMGLLYVLGWVLTTMRIRLDTYVDLLEASLSEGDSSGNQAVE